MSDETPTRFDPLPAALQTHLQHQRSLIAARVAPAFRRCRCVAAGGHHPAARGRCRLIDRDDGDG